MLLEHADHAPVVLPNPIRCVRERARVTVVPCVVVRQVHAAQGCESAHQRADEGFGPVVVQVRNGEVLDARHTGVV